MKKDCFMTIECINGNCPRSLAYANDTRDDDALGAYANFKKLKCKDCHYNTGDCKDCSWYQTEYCIENKKLTKQEFIDTYCKLCGTQRCGGVDDPDWFAGCKHKNQLI